MRVNRTFALSVLLALGAVGLAACGSGGTETVTVQSTVTERTVTEVPPPGTTTTTTSGGETTAATHGPALSSFRSPSANIGCAMSARSVRCDIRERTWSPPPNPPDCPVDYGQGVEVSTVGSGHLVCAGDTTLNPSAPVLGYGRSTAAGSLSCVSSEAGIACRNSGSGHGFFISRQAYRVY